ncbi:hypothetical protein BDV96DRAFT_595680 [Lophiotrema nucula]|uniref:Uncharacterized protein n=1 Tax=Lophiotrema nucula TaxID=690887 RepID=A0A6A5ZMJ9_9PLEO|nr:hypothetical protein BDV96DRAFT_595680 [Lophiotrema nucula]
MSLKISFDTETELIAGKGATSINDSDIWYIIKYTTKEGKEGEGIMMRPPNEIHPLIKVWKRMRKVTGKILKQELLKKYKEDCTEKDLEDVKILPEFKKQWDAEDGGWAGGAQTVGGLFPYQRLILLITDLSAVGTRAREIWSEGGTVMD